MIKSTGMEWTGATSAARVRTVTVAAGAFLFAAVAIYAVVDGPRLHAMSEQAAAATEDAESQAVCERLGIPSSSGGYAACASELAAVRQRREERAERRNSRFL
jgi:hypothetical protein